MADDEHESKNPVQIFGTEVVLLVFEQRHESVELEEVTEFVLVLQDLVSIHDAFGTEFAQIAFKGSQKLVLHLWGKVLI